MRFLADESCDFAVIHALRANGHDVIAVSEVTPRAEDSEVIRLGDNWRQVYFVGIMLRCQVNRGCCSKGR